MNFKIGIPKIGNSIGNWLKPIGTVLQGLISPSIRNLFKIGSQPKYTIQDKTEENLETQIGGNMQNNNPSISGTPSGTPSGTTSGTPSGTTSGTPSGTTSGTPSETTSGTPSETPTEQTQTVSNNASVQNAFEVAKQLRNEQWAREDEVRKHVVEREDNAYQRMVNDMNKAGINPNLVNIQPSASGGGISNSTGMDYNLYEQELNKNLELIMQEIENNFKGTQNEKDRFSELIGKVLQLAGLMSFKK